MTQKPSEDTEKISRVTAKWELCDVRYVNYKAAVITVAGFVGITVALAFTGGRWGAGIESQIRTIEGRCVAIENMITRIDTIGVTVDKILREVEHD